MSYIWCPTSWVCSYIMYTKQNENWIILFMPVIVKHSCTISRCTKHCNKCWWCIHVTFPSVPLLWQNVLQLPEVRIFIDPSWNAMSHSGTEQKVCHVYSHSMSVYVGRSCTKLHTIQHNYKCNRKSCSVKVALQVVIHTVTQRTWSRGTEKDLTYNVFCTNMYQPVKIVWKTASQLFSPNSTVYTLSSVQKVMLMCHVKQIASMQHCYLQ